MELNTFDHFWPDFLINNPKVYFMRDTDKKQPREGATENVNTGNNPEKKRQQQSDPQVTELKGFVDPHEDLEPTLEDGTKAPEKAPR